MKKVKDNLTFTADSVNDKLIHIKDKDTDAAITQKELFLITGRFKIAGYNPEDKWNSKSIG